MERASFITYKNKNILFIDLSNCSKNHALGVIEKSKNIIKEQPKYSVLALADINNENLYIPDVFLAMQEFVKHNKPYIKASAIVAPGERLKLFIDILSYSSDRKFSAFDDIQKAKDWLIEYSL
ncbi:MAG: hypothetical protein PHC29_07375 [Candidatus Omnitrophica bacterium]|nr:hypothetical protein [Candidatus Omnitrophota bacterium]